MANKLRIAIIGSGPAGATLARLLNEQYEVTLFDKKAWDGDQGFMKPCGGLLAPGSQKTLRKQGLTFPPSIYVYPQQKVVHTYDLSSPHSRTYKKNYINVDRHKFDLWLCSLVPDRVRVFDKTIVTSVSESNHKYRVTWNQHNHIQTEDFDLLVGADGANSIVRKTFFSSKIRQYTAIQEWYPIGTTKAHYGAYFDEKLTPSYAWSDTKDDHYIIGAALIQSNAPHNFIKLSDQIKTIFPTNETIVKREACLVNCPSKLRDFKFSSSRVALIGEAAGLVSPSSLEGISHALRSGEMLAKLLNRYSLNGLIIYRFQAFKLVLRIAIKSLRIPAMYWPRLRRLVLWSGILSHKE